MCGVAERLERGSEILLQRELHDVRHRATGLERNASYVQYSVCILEREAASLRSRVGSLEASKKENDEAISDLRRELSQQARRLEEQQVPPCMSCI